MSGPLKLRTRGRVLYRELANESPTAFINYNGGTGPRSLIRLGVGSWIIPKYIKGEAGG